MEDCNKLNYEKIRKICTKFPLSGIIFIYHCFKMNFSLRVVNLLQQNFHLWITFSQIELFGVVFFNQLYINSNFHQRKFSLCQSRQRHDSRGVAKWTCVSVLALGQRFDSHSRRLLCRNPLGQGINCTLSSILGWDLKQEVPCLCTHYTAHT